MTIGRKDGMNNIMYTSAYESRLDELGMLQLSFYIHKQTNGRSDRIAKSYTPHITPNVIDGGTMIKCPLFTIII